MLVNLGSSIKHANSEMGVGEGRGEVEGICAAGRRLGAGKGVFVFGYM